MSILCLQKKFKFFISNKFDLKRNCFPRTQLLELLNSFLFRKLPSFILRTFVINLRQCIGLRDSKFDGFSEFETVKRPTQVVF